MPHSVSSTRLLTRVQSASVPGKRERARRAKDLVKILFTAGIVLVGALLYVWQHIQIIRLGYNLESLNSELSALTQEEKELTVKIAELKSLGRIEEMARRRLGMTEPTPSQIILLSSDRATPAHTPPGR